MVIKEFYHAQTFTLTYLIYDEKTLDGVVIDPVLDFDVLASQTSTLSVEEVATFIENRRIKLHYVLETHAHADHLSGSQFLKRRFDSLVAIGERITLVQETFKPVFDLPAAFPTDGSQFDRLLQDGEVLRAGGLEIKVLATPGHTPACVSYLIGDAVFTGDALFIEDYGTGRCDFPQGSAADLYHSVRHVLYQLPDATRVFVGHDYQPGGRALRSETTILESKLHNIQLKAETSREAFIEFRTARDAKLEAPRLLFQSVQVNIDAGHLPSPHSNGKRYLISPLNPFKPTDEVGSRLDLKSK